MSVSMFDAMVEAAHPGRSRAELSTFERIRFRLLDGSVRTIENAVACPAIADQLRPGNKARFYVFEGLERRGVHGVRYANGWVLYDFPDTNAKILRLLSGVSLGWILLNLIIEHEISLIGFAVLVLTTGAYALLKQTQREAEWQVGSDYSFVRTLPMLPPPERSAASSNWVPLVARVEPAAAAAVHESRAQEVAEPEISEAELVEPQIIQRAREEPADVIELPGPGEQQPVPEPANERLAAAVK
jgi:hypothetical protein